jgi:hypothetical protein
LYSSFDRQQTFFPSLKEHHQLGYRLNLKEREIKEEDNCRFFSEA